ASRELTIREAGFREFSGEAMSVPWLVFCGVYKSDCAHQIRQGKHIIGRLRDCDIRIDHPSVSRRHAEITSDANDLKIEDLRSANGTFVNGQHVAMAQLQIGDMIRIGDVSLELVSDLSMIRAVASDEDETERARGDGPSSVDAIAGMLSP